MSAKIGPVTFGYNNCCARFVWYRQRWMTVPNLEAVIQHCLSSCHRLLKHCALVYSSIRDTCALECFKPAKNSNTNISMHLWLTGCGCIATLCWTLSLSKRGVSGSDGACITGSEHGKI